MTTLEFNELGNVLIDDNNNNNKKKKKNFDIRFFLFLSFTSSRLSMKTVNKCTEWFVLCCFVIWSYVFNIKGTRIKSTDVVLVPLLLLTLNTISSTFPANIFQLKVTMRTLGKGAKYVQN